MQNIEAKFLCEDFLMEKFVISVAKGNRGAMENTKGWWKGLSSGSSPSRRF